MHIHLERFEGPLGLLLYLIRKEEMDIFDININQITQQYLSYIKVMKKFDLEQAGDFIAMAATLIQIKSRMLLPSYSEDEDGIDEGNDPRRELVQKLLEYQKFKEVAGRLYERPLVGRDIWLRGFRETISADDEPDVIIEDNALYALIAAYRKAVMTAKKSVHRVGVELQSIGARIMEIRDRLIVGNTVKMSSLIDAPEPEVRDGQLLVTFLSLLELAKIGLVRLFQSQNFDEIHVEAVKKIESHVLERVEEYESVSDEVTASIFGPPVEMDEDEAKADDESREPAENAQLADVQAEPGDADSEDVQPEDSHSADAQSMEAQLENAQPTDTQSGDVKPEDGVLEAKVDLSVDVGSTEMVLESSGRAESSSSPEPSSQIEDGVELAQLNFAGEELVVDDRLKDVAFQNEEAHFEEEESVETSEAALVPSTDPLRGARDFSSETDFVSSGEIDLGPELLPIENYGPGEGPATDDEILEEELKMEQEDRETKENSGETSGSGAN